MAVGARVGGRFRVGRASKSSVGFAAGIDSGVGLACGCVGGAISEVGELVPRTGGGGVDGMAVSGKRAKVGNSVDASGTQAVKNTRRHKVRIWR